MDSGTIFPEIKAGVATGQGTEICPMKNRLLAVLLIILGLKKAVFVNIFANPYALEL